MKNKLIKIAAVFTVAVLIAVTFSACSGNPSDTESTQGNDTSSAVSINSDPNVIKDSSIINPNASAIDPDKLGESDLEYLQKLFACMSTIHFTSKYELNDQTCMQIVESILRYQDTTGDSFFMEVEKDGSGNFVISKETAETICTDMLNYTMLHNSDYLVGDQYVFPASSAAKIPAFELLETKTMGSIFMITYTTTYEGNDPVKHIASVFRRTTGSTPFRFQSLTINSLD